MEVFIWFLCAMIGGSAAFLCNEIACDDSPLGELRQLDFRPKEADLLRLCPPTLDFFDCYFKGAKDCFGMEVQEIADSGDGFASAVAQPLLNGRNLAVEMCDENSALRRDYLESVECFERLVDNDTDVHFVCAQKGELHADAFLKQYHNIKEDVDMEELDCLKQVYPLACFTEQLEITCGEGARRAFLAILEKIKTSVYTQCNVENSLSLKRSFFEYLELDGNSSELYWFIFKTF